MKSLILALKTTPVVYITRDLERASAGLHLKNYFIITNSTPFGKELAKKHANIIVIPNKLKLDTRDLLAHPKTVAFLNTLVNPRIVVFKNTREIETICATNNWTLLNPGAEFASTVEEKISQVRWLGELNDLLPPHHIQLGEDLLWSGEKYIIQFNRAHTGLGTILIESAEQLEEIKKKFPKREIRVTQFIDGPALTNNNVVWGNDILLGNINFQITGLSPFTDKPFATIGNDWELGAKMLSQKQRDDYRAIATAVGKKLAGDGWRGLFGIDVIVDKHTGKLYLLEINARQPASTTYESTLQHEIGQKSATSVTTFEAHLAALLGISRSGETLTTITTGAQIIQRVTSTRKTIQEGLFERLRDLPVALTPYRNTEPGSDLLRIQTKRGIMKEATVFNALGTTIAYTLDTNQKKGYRAGVIIIRDKKILLMKRRHGGIYYHSIPGGKPERFETLFAVANREGREETNLRFEIDTTKEPLTLESNKRNLYYFTKKVSGTPRLGGPEQKKNSPENYYELQWLTADELTKATLRQAELKPILVHLLKK